MTRSFREIRQKARRTVHEKFQVAATCYPDGEPNGASVEAHIRVHSAIVEEEQSGGERQYVARRLDIQPELIFWIDEHIPVAGEIVIVSEREGYEIKTLVPATRSDSPTMTVEVVTLSQDRIATFRRHESNERGWGDSWNEAWNGDAT